MIGNVFDGLVILLALTGVVTLASVGVGYAERRGWLDDAPMPWEIDTPCHVRVLNPGGCPVPVEGSDSRTPGAVVGDREDARAETTPGSGSRPGGRTV